MKKISNAARESNENEDKAWAGDVEREHSMRQTDETCQSLNENHKMKI